MESRAAHTHPKNTQMPPPGNKADVEFDNTKLINFICSKLNADTFYNIPLLTPKQTTSIVEKISSNKASGYDGISVRVLEKFCTGIWRCVMQISMNSFPNNWKVAKVRPLHKGGARNDKNNYRPISACFNCLSSRRFLNEKHVANSLFKFVRDNNLLYQLQSASRSGYSTETTLIRLTRSDINNGQWPVDRFGVYRFSQSFWCNWSWTSSKKSCLSTGFVPLPSLGINRTCLRKSSLLL